MRFMFNVFKKLCLPDLQESNGGAIHRVGNYPDLLSNMSRYCCLVEI